MDKDIETTTVYMHLLNLGGLGFHSPLDGLQKPMSIAIGRIRLPDRCHRQNPILR